jgi:hypothetical protein
MRPQKAGKICAREDLFFLFQTVIEMKKPPRDSVAA